MSEFTTAALDALIAVAIGGVTGLLPGLFGVGGGFLMVPLLHLYAGTPIAVAVGSCACQSLGSVTTGLLHRRAAGELHYRLACWMLPGTIAGLAAGIACLNWTKTVTAPLVWNGRSVPLIEVSQLVCYLAIMLLLAAVVAVETYFARDEHEATRRGWLAELPLPPYIALPEIGGRTASFWVVTLLAIVVGFLNGGFGMGGSVLLVPGLVYLIGLSTHGAIAVTMVSSWLAGSFSAATHAASGNVDLELACWLLLGGTIGSRIGSAIAERLSGRRLRGYFSLVILASTGFIFYRLWQLGYGGSGGAGH